MSSDKPRFQFTDAEKELIKQHVAEVEADDGAGQYSICQLFENDDLFYVVGPGRDAQLPTMLDEIDFDFLNRPFGR